MSNPLATTWGAARRAAQPLHDVLLGVALIVPLYAIGDALGSLLNPDRAALSSSFFTWGRWAILLLNSTIVCGVAVGVALTIGGVLGLLLMRTNLPGRMVLLAVTLFGACMPPYVITVFVLTFIPPGWFQQDDLAWTVRYFATGTLYGLTYIPLATLLIGAAARAVDRDIEEQALLDASAFAVVRRVTLPLIRGALGATGLLIVLLVATDITISDVLLARTFAEECFTQFQIDRQRAGPLLTGLPVLLVLAVALLMAQARLRIAGGSTPWHAVTTPRIFALRRWRVVLGVGVVLSIMVAAAVPLIGLCSKLTAGAVATAAIGAALVRSTILAVTAAVIVVVPGLGLAWIAARGAWWRRFLVTGGVMLLLALPGPVVGISLIGLLNRPGPLGWVYDHATVVVLAYVVRFLPIGILLLIPAMARTPVELEWAARVDGCDWLGVHRHVRWPAARREAAVVALVVMILCFGEISSTVLVVPPGSETAAVRAFTLMHFGVYGDLAALTLLSMACILLPWGGLVVALWRVGRGRGGVNGAVVPGG